MKVILVSNFDLDTVNDKIIAENVDAATARNLCNEWNEKNLTPFSEYYARVFDDRYVPHVWKP